MSRYSRPAVVALVLECRADEKSKCEIARLLLAAGAKPLQPDSEGERAVDNASKCLLEVLSASPLTAPAPSQSSGDSSFAIVSSMLTMFSQNQLRWTWKRWQLEGMRPRSTNSAAYAFAAQKDEQQTLRLRPIGFGWLLNKAIRMLSSIWASACSRVAVST